MPDTNNDELRVEEEQELTPEQERAQREQELSEKLGKVLDQNQDESGMLGRLLANPQVREVMAAQQDGRQVRVVSESETKTEESISTLKPDVEGLDLSVVEDLEELSRKDFAKAILGQAVKTLGGVLESNLGKLNKKVESFEGYVQDGERKAIQDEIATAKETYKDFNAYGKEIFELHQKHNSLNVDDLYWMAKRMYGDRSLPTVESERPTHTGGRPPIKRQRKTPLALGRAGMGQLLSEAFSNIDFTGISGE